MATVETPETAFKGGKPNPHYLNVVTRNYPENALRPLEISQATYEALLLVFMNDMGDETKFFGLAGNGTIANNEYMKALGTFIMGEPLGEYSWPSNWLTLLYAEFQDVFMWQRALNWKRNNEVENKMFVGSVLQCMLKRTVRSLAFETFLTRGFNINTNPVQKQYANPEAGTQRDFPSALSTRRVLEPLIIPYRTSGMFGDCNPMNPVNNLDTLTKWFDKSIGPTAPTNILNLSTAFTCSMIDFYKANIFPDPELFLPYMIALSPSIRNAQLAIEEYQTFANMICQPAYDECCDPFLSILMNRQIPAIPNFEKNYLLLIEKFNFNRDYLKVAVGPIIQNMVLPIAVKFGVFDPTVSDGVNLQDRRKKRIEAQRTNGHRLFSTKQDASLIPSRLGIRGDNIPAKFWHAYMKNLVFSYQNPKLFYYPHWLYACSSRYIRADEALRDRDFVVINIESPSRSYLVRWCNIKNFLTRDSCNLAVLMSQDGIAISRMRIMSFENYIQMIPRPHNETDTWLTGNTNQNQKLVNASFTNCFENVCVPNSNNPCPPALGEAPLPELP